MANINSNRDASIASETKKSVLNIIGFTLAVITIIGSTSIYQSKFTIIDSVILIFACISFIFFGFAFLFMDSAWHSALEKNNESFNRSFSNGLMLFRVGFFMLILQPGIILLKFLGYFFGIVYFIILASLFIWYRRKT